MTQTEIAEIKRVVEAYSRKKSAMMEKVKEIEDLSKQGRISPWHKDIHIGQLWNDLVATPERKEFCEYADKTKTDEEFEKYFRAAFSEAFLNHPLDPQKL